MVFVPVERRRHRPEVERGSTLPSGYSHVLPSKTPASLPPIHTPSSGTSSSTTATAASWLEELTEVGDLLSEILAEVDEDPCAPVFHEELVPTNLPNTTIVHYRWDGLPS